MPKPAPTPYRQLEEIAEPERPRAELVYLVKDRERRLTAGGQIAIGGAVVAGILYMFGLLHLAAGAAVIGGLAGLWTWRRSPETSGLELRVESGELVVRVRSTKREIARTRLSKLTNVTLDSKSIRKVEPGNDFATGMSFINSRVGGELDVSRLALDVEGSSRVLLSEEFHSHMEILEWAGKIRSFLRSHGWVPHDERVRIADEDDGDEDDGEADEDGEGDGEEDGDGEEVLARDDDGAESAGQRGHLARRIGGEG